MECIDCGFYISEMGCIENGNECGVAGFTYFKQEDNCKLVNDDGNINQED